MVTKTTATTEGEHRRLCLLSLVSLVMIRTGISEARLGLALRADPRFVSDLRRGRRPKPETFLRDVKALADMQATDPRGRGLEP